MHILVFGDSITYGAWDVEGGWVQRLRKYLDEQQLEDPKKYYLVYNLGVSGDTTSDLMKRIVAETVERTDEKEKTLVIFSIGANDACIDSSTKKTVCDEKQFRDNIESLIEETITLCPNIAFTGLLPVDESKTNPLPWNKYLSCSNDALTKFNSIIRSVCEMRGIHYIELASSLPKIDKALLLQDGQHPTTYGHEKIFEIIRDYLLKNNML